MKKITVLAIFVMVITNIFAYSMMNKESGNFVSDLNARSSAMGGAVTVGGKNLLDATVNPANLKNLKEGFSFQLATGLITDKEDRSLPMYDSFDAYAGNAVYASNSHSFLSNGFAISYKKNLGIIAFSPAFIYRPYVDFNAKYEEEVRNNENSNYDNYPPIIANNYYEGKGTVNSYDLVLNASFNNRISAGIILSKLKGNSTLKRDMIWSKQARDMMVSSPDSLVDEHFKMTRDFDGLNFGAGFSYKISERMTAGFSYISSTDLTVTGKVNGISFTAKDTLGNPLEVWGYNYQTELDSLGNLTIIDSTAISYDDKFNPCKLPARFRFGFLFKPRNIMRTNFNFDMEYVAWSKVNSMYDDAINYYFGVEHKTRFYMPLRFGFAYTTDYKIDFDKPVYWASKITMPTFTVGSGFSYGKHLSVDFSAAFSHRTYKALDLFPDHVYDHQELWSNYNYLNLQDRGWENPDTVNEDFITFKTSVNFNW